MNDSWLKENHVYRYVLITIVLGLILFFIIDSNTNQFTENELKEMGKAFLSLEPVWLVISYFCITIVFTVINVPMTLLAVTGGFIFSTKCGFFLGICIGSVVNIVGFTIGAMLCFSLSVTCFRDEHYIKNYEYLNGLDIALQKNGILINLLLRITPILPASVLNYSLPALGSSLVDFSIGCLIGTIPYSILMTVFGAFLADTNSPFVAYITQVPTWVTAIVAVVGLLLLGASIWIMIIFTQKEIDEIKVAGTTSSIRSANQANGDRTDDECRDSDLVYEAVTPLLTDDVRSSSEV